MAQAAARKAADDDAAGFWVQRLRKDGYCIIPDAMSRNTVAALHADLASAFAEAPFGVGDFYGHRTKRFQGLLKRSPRAAAFVLHPLILDIAEHILGPYCDKLQLNLTQAVAIHPGERRQMPHRDHDLWWLPRDDVEYQVNVMWPFSPFRRANGATLIWPGSHLKRQDRFGDLNDAVAAELAPGAALVWLGSTVHGAGANRTDDVRSGMIVSYCLGWLKPFENQWLVYPPAVARHFPPALAALVGYRQHRPNLGNVEGQCPSVLLGDRVPDYLEATDAMLPQQRQALRTFSDSQAYEA